MTRFKKVIPTVLLLVLGLNTAQAAECLTDLKQIPRSTDLNDLSTTWTETGADDGKPLQIKLTDRGNQILATFIKPGEGKWIEGIAEICANGVNRYEMRLSRIEAASKLQNYVSKEMTLPLSFSKNRKSLKTSIKFTYGMLSKTAKLQFKAM